MTLVAGVDSSTQSCKIVIRELETGKIVRSGSSPHPEGTEVHPNDWWAAFENTLKMVGGLDDVAAIGVGGQQHGMVCLDEDGIVVRPALLWNDTRSAQDATDLVDELGAAHWAEATGSVPVTSFTVSKLRWLARNEPESLSRTTAVCLPHDWLTWRLGGLGIDALTTDRGDASGTGYWSPTDGYRNDLLELATGRSDFVLPRVAGPAELVGLFGSISTSAGTGDNMAAALGLNAADTDVVMSVGTSGVVSVVTSTPTADPTGTVAGFADATGNFLPLVCTLNAGLVLGAVTSLLGLEFDEFDRLALSASAGASGLTLLPFFAGERTPNRPNARGVLAGIDLANLQPANLARAAVEAVACGLSDGLDAVRNCGIETGRVVLVGGGARLRSMQLVLSGVLETEVVVPTPGEYVAEGAAVQAAWALTGSRPEWDASVRTTVTADPTPEIVEKYRSLRDATGPDRWPRNQT